MKRILYSVVIAVAILITLRVEIMVIGAEVAYDFLSIFGVDEYPNIFLDLSIFVLSLIAAYILIGIDILMTLTKSRAILLAIAGLVVIIVLMGSKQLEYVVVYIFTLAFFLSAFFLCKIFINSYIRLNRLSSDVGAVSSEVNRLSSDVGAVSSEVNRLRGIETLVSQNKIVLSAIGNHIFNEDDYKTKLMSSMPKADGNMRLCQETLLILFEDFVRFCNENNIEYWVSYGTLIGTLRHKGFVPWDDDIDVSMSIIEFEKLYSAIYEGTTPFDLILIYSKGIRIIYKDMPFPFVDIYVYRFSSYDCEEAMGKFRQDHSNYDRQIPSLQITGDIVSLKEKRSAVESIIQDVAGEITIDPVSAKSVTYRANHFECWAFDKESVYPLKRGVFEYLDVYIPRDPDVILKTVYGDYWALPTDVTTHSHSDFNVIIPVCKYLLKKRRNSE